MAGELSGLAWIIHEAGRSKGQHGLPGSNRHRRPSPYGMAGELSRLDRAMPLSLRESQDIDELASIFYDMLPGSGSPRLSFPTVAQQLGLTGYWVGGSKRPAI